ncbi:hypothetical protein Sango_1595700 [Sesamum angolense]|uniref:Reverse transcriptase Ty1/copia-type domain-containing protein n=1 Tax=Sesamum angolense TaxID=2727404 RepID=A0AAE1WQG5_9LAMI|nr:hypothetical protein Sango_1595700 [Sesamum angolense]
MVSTASVPILYSSTRDSRPPDRYRFLRLTSQLDNDPRTYGEALSDINSNMWPEANRFEMGSMDPNKVWTLIDLSKGVKPVGCNGFTNPEGFTCIAEEQKVFRLQRSIYGLKQVSRSWNTHFDEVICGYDFIKNECNPCVHKKISGSTVAYLVLYVDDIVRIDIFLIGNDVKVLGNIKAWLSTQVSMKEMREDSYILGIKIYRDRSKWMLGFTQSSYIEKVLKKFKMENSKRGFLPMRHRIKLSKEQSPKTDEELKRMSNIPYASAVESIQYAV